MHVIRGRTVFSRFFLAACLASGVLSNATAQSIPAQLSDSEFWRLITEFSEPGGYFRSDNFVGNEGSLQYVIPEMQRSLKPVGVYLGVAPDQNFTYVVALKPKIAFIIDIRRQNMLQHLLYKALIEMSADRAEFLSRLFSRPRPAGLDANSSAEDLFRAYDSVAADSSLYRRNFAAVTDWLVRHHNFALSKDDLGSMEYVFSAFYSAGPHITYSYPNGGGGGNFGRGMPGYVQLMLESDGQGTQRSYLANEVNYRILKEFQTKNLIIPLVGDFAGPKAVRAVGQYLKERKAFVSAFYTSNVEQYLFRQEDDWRKFYTNVATLPIDSTSLFIRSLSNGTGFRPGSPNSRSVQVVSSIAELIKAFNEGRILGYNHVIQMSK